MKQNTIETKGYRIRNVIRLIRSMKPYAGEMWLTVLSVFLKHMSTIGAAVLAASMAALSMTGELAVEFPKMMTALTICVVLRALSYYGEMWFGHDAAYRIQKDIRVQMYGKIEQLAPAYMKQRNSSQIGATVMGDIELLEWFLAHTFGSFLMSIVITILLVAALSTIHLVLAVLVFVFAVLIGVTPHVLYKVADKQGKEVREKTAQSNAVIMEGIQGLKDILALNYVEAYEKKNKRNLEQLYQSETRFAKRVGLENGAMQLFVGGFTVSLMVVTANYIRIGQLDFAAYPMVIMLSMLIFNPIIEVSNYCRNLGVLFAAASRVQDIFEEEPEVSDTGEAVSVGDLQTDISFEDVTFGYEKNRAPILEAVNFKVPKGTTVALVGPSGVGKTTCVNLLLRYWEIWEGAIKIGGIDIRSMSLENLRSLTSAVLQDIFLFHITVRENIRLGRPDASDEEVEAAAKKAYAHAFIIELPDGYDTITGERGFRLSGGQRQRISIARAILRDAPILILDEAVSSLDTENERLIQKALDEQAKSRTTLVIAHRLSTIQNADCLVVIKDGRVVQTGTHKQLLAQKGFYSELMEHQLD